MFRLTLVFGLLLGWPVLACPMLAQSDTDERLIATGPECVLDSCVIPGRCRLSVRSRTVRDLRNRQIGHRLLLRAESLKEGETRILWGPVDSTYIFQVCAALRDDVQPVRFARCSLDVRTGISGFQEFVLAEPSGEPPAIRLEEIRPWQTHANSKPDRIKPDPAWAHNLPWTFRSRAMIEDKVGPVDTFKYGLHLRELRWNGKSKEWEMVFLAGRDKTVTFFRGEKEDKWRISQ